MLQKLDLPPNWNTSLGTKTTSLDNFKEEDVTGRSGC